MHTAIFKTDNQQVPTVLRRKELCSMLCGSLNMKICWRRDRLPTPVFWGFPCGSAGKESTCNAGDVDSIPGLGRSPGEGKGYALQYSGLENSMDYKVHGVAKRLSLFTFKWEGSLWESGHTDMYGCLSLST